MVWSEWSAPNGPLRPAFHTQQRPTDQCLIRPHCVSLDHRLQSAVPLSSGRGGGRAARFRLSAAAQDAGHLRHVFVIKTDADMSERSDHRKLDWHPNLAQFGKAAGTLALLLVLGAAPSAAWAFDRGGFKARAEATLAELNTKRLADSRATRARSEEHTS